MVSDEDVRDNANTVDQDARHAAKMAKKKAARAGWEKAKELILDGSLRMVVLDEINIALRYDYLDVAEVVDVLQHKKPPLTHVVLTGRNAKQELIDAADLVTEMTLIKHPFRSGIKAQAGVEF